MTLYNCTKLISTNYKDKITESMVDFHFKGMRYNYTHTRARNKLLKKTKILIGQIMSIQ